MARRVAPALRFVCVGLAVGLAISASVVTPILGRVELAPAFVPVGFAQRPGDQSLISATFDGARRFQAASATSRGIRGVLDRYGVDSSGVSVLLV
jgi:hypothetical protein